MKEKIAISESKNLAKGIGRITYPADPKITNRSDQQIKEVKSPTQIKAAAGVASIRHQEEDKSIANAIYPQHLKATSEEFRHTGLTTNSNKRDIPQIGFSHPGNESVKEHEGTHSLISQIKDIHGQEEASKFVDHLISNIHPDVKAHIEKRLVSEPHYKKQKQSTDPEMNFAYKQEIVTSLRDHGLNSSGNSRRSLQDSSGIVRPEHQDLDNKIKSSWKKVREAAANYGAKNLIAKSGDSLSEGITGSDLFEFAGMGNILYSSDDLAKQAFTSQDQETLIDSKVHLAALQSLPKELLDFAAKNLSPMKVDEIAQFKIFNNIIKLRKNGPDLYSGWVESGGSITHKFEKVTAPQLLMQLQSQLELYGKEKEIEAPSVPAEPLTETGEQLSAHKEDKTADHAAKVKEKIEELQENVKKEIPLKEIMPSLDNPESECDACNLPPSECSCYSALSRPTIEIDLKSQKIRISFNSEWSQEDRENFQADIKRRAAVLVGKQYDLIRGKK